jgi:hypothetical protein
MRIGRWALVAAALVGWLPLGPDHPVGVWSRRRRELPIDDRVLRTRDSRDRAPVLSAVTYNALLGAFALVVEHERESTRRKKHRPWPGKIRCLRSVREAGKLFRPWGFAAKRSKARGGLSGHQRRDRSQVFVRWRSARLVRVTLEIRRACPEPFRPKFLGGRPNPLLGNASQYGMGSPDLPRGVGGGGRSARLDSGTAGTRCNIDSPPRRTGVRTCVTGPIRIRNMRFDRQQD